MRSFLAILFFAALAANAENIYVSQNGDGTTNSIAWLNTAGNWGAGLGKVSAGDAVHLVGRLTNGITIQASGMAGSPITIYFESGAKFSNPTWPSPSSIINLNGKDYIVIDGGADGLIEATDNGTTAAYGGSHTYDNDLINGIYGDVASSVRDSHIVIQNLTISNIYDRLPISDDPCGMGGGQGISFMGSDITISNCIVRGMQDPISLNFDPVGVTDITIISNYVRDFNHGVKVSAGRAANAWCTNLYILGNDINGRDTFSQASEVETIDLGFHRNCIMIFCETEDYSGGFYHYRVLGNRLHQGEDTSSYNSAKTAGTSAFFTDGYKTAQFLDGIFANNICTLAPGITWGNGFCNGMGEGYIANNIFAGAGKGVQSHRSQKTYNNIFLTNGTPITEQITSGTGFLEYMFAISGYNCLYGATECSILTMRYKVDAEPTFLWDAVLTGSGGATSRLARIFSSSGWYIDTRWGTATNAYGETISGTNGQTLTLSTSAPWTQASARQTGDIASWKAWSGNDSNSIASDPLINTTTWALATNSPCIGAGTNLYALGITNDYFGNARPSEGSWTIGPILASGGSPSPDPPTGRTLIIYNNATVGTLRGP